MLVTTEEKDKRIETKSIEVTQTQLVIAQGLS
jgi:hypothetical protein